MSTSKPYRTLVIDDEPDVTELLQYKLEQEGYNCTILCPLSVWPVILSLI